MRKVGTPGAGASESQVTQVRSHSTLDRQCGGFILARDRAHCPYLDAGRVCMSHMRLDAGQAVLVPIGPVTFSATFSALGADRLRDPHRHLPGGILIDSFHHHAHQLFSS